jgi:type IV secretory pathway TrbF-like protein
MSAENPVLRNLSRTVPVPKEETFGPYLEVKTGLEMMNRIQRYIILACLLALVTVCGIAWKAWTSLGEIRPVVVRIDESGDAVVAPYATLEYKPREIEIRSFLSRFVRDHYGRRKATADEAWQRQLHFMEASMAWAAMEDEKRNKTIAKFVEGADPEIDIVIRQVRVTNLQSEPYQASVEYDKVFRQAHDPTKREINRERWTSDFRFKILPKVPNDMLIENPLGLVVIDIEENQGFVQ